MGTKKKQILLSHNYSKVLRRDLHPVDTDHATTCLPPDACHTNKDESDTAWISQHPG